MPPALNADWNLGQLLFCQGVPFRAIADRLGVPASTVRQRAHRFNWHAARDEALAVTTRAVIDHDGATLTNRSRGVRSALGAELEKAAQALEEIPVKHNLDHIGVRAEISGKLASAAERTFGWNTDSVGRTLVDMEGLAAAAAAHDAIDVESTPIAPEPAPAEGGS